MGKEELIARASELFKSTFKADPEYVGVAPGRVNLIGEHTDYCDGFVFPLALEHSTVVLGKKREDGKPIATVISHIFDDARAEFEITDGMTSGEPQWSNYVRGMVSRYKTEGHDVSGFDAVICTDVPVGGGVSSSAALEMATAMFLEALSGKSVDPATRALWGQKCEHTFVGLMCGIMDQMISSKATEGHALLIDCRSYDCEAVPLTDPEVSIVVCNSNVKHQLTGSEYPTRVAQCKKVAETIGVPQLRDATMAMLDEVRDKLDDEEYRRGRHVISENERVIEAKKALIAQDYKRVGELMAASHASLRDDYNVSIEQIDFLVDLANSFDGVHGSRITGGGFGGCTVTLVAADRASALQETLKEKFREAHGVDATTFVTKPGAGATQRTLNN